MILIRDSARPPGRASQPIPRRDRRMRAIDFIQDLARDDRLAGGACYPLPPHLPAPGGLSAILKPSSAHAARWMIDEGDQTLTRNRVMLMLRTRRDFSPPLFGSAPRRHHGIVLMMQVSAEMDGRFIRYGAFAGLALCFLSGAIASHSTTIIVRKALGD